MRCRLHAVEIEGRKLVDMVEDHAELGRDPFGIPVVQLEPGQASHVLDVGARDAGGHVAESTIRSELTREDLLAKHPFLSDEWFALVEQLVEVHGAQGPAEVELTTNVIVTETPFGDERHLNMSSRGGRGHIGIGHAPDADTTVTTDYDTAREMFTSADPNAALQAFMAGKVRIQGDLAKMMAAQASGNPAANAALLEAIQGITE